MENNKNILFIGHGYVSQYFCSHIVTDYKISASLNKSKNKYFKTPDSIELISFQKIDFNFLDKFQNIIISIPPFYDLKTDVILNKFHDYFLNRKSLYKLIYLSATSVYGDHKREKVSENSKLKAQSKNGLARIACENKYLELGNNNSANIIILRLAAIYGDIRNNIDYINNKRIIDNKISNRLISRTHITDICQIIKQIISSQEIQNEIFNISDGNPCSTKELNDYICESLLKIDKLPINEQKEESRHSSFALDNKIIDNSKLQKLLNYNFIFPSYKEGLNQIYKNLKLK